ncbi:MAG: DMT family transporter [Caldisericia bacterium]|nr:DMT family transporter [Caldisericia bacterium]
MKNKTFLGYLAILGSVFIWSATFIWTKEIFDANAYTPITIIVVRLIVSIVFMFLWSWIFRQDEKIEKKDWFWLVLLAFLEPFLYFIGELFGLVRVSSTVTSVIIATIPLFTPFALSFFFKEKIGLANIIGIAVSLVGVYLLLIKETLEIKIDLLGVGFLFFAVLSAVGYSVVIYRIIHKYKPLTIVKWQNTFGLLFFLPWFLFSDLGVIAKSGFQWAYFDNLVYLGLLGSMMAFLLYIYSVKYITIWLANAFSNLIPVMTAILSFFILGEKLLPINIVGIGVAIAGLFVSQYKTKQVIPVAENY